MLREKNKQNMSMEKSNMEVILYIYRWHPRFSDDFVYFMDGPHRVEMTLCDVWTVPWA